MSLEALMTSLSLAFRQKWAVYQIIDIAKNLTPQKFVAGIAAIFELFGLLVFDGATTPRGQSLDLSGYELVVSDEFNGDELDLSLWHHRVTGGSNRVGYSAPSQVSVRDGNMYITAQYLTDGEFGEGWYSGAVSLNERYTYGYYEIRCICNKDEGFWSAFWLQTPGSYIHSASQGGPGGAEIDIFEAMRAQKTNNGDRNSITSSIHLNGYDDNPDEIDSYILGSFKGNNIYEEFNTYGLEWTEDEYIFYVNGVETVRTSFGNGVSRVPEEVIVSLERPDTIDFAKDYSTVMTVDYVRIYQKAG